MDRALRHSSLRPLTLPRPADQSCTAGAPCVQERPVGAIDIERTERTVSARVCASFPARAMEEPEMRNWIHIIIIALGCIVSLPPSPVLAGTCTPGATPLSL